MSIENIVVGIFHLFYSNEKSKPYIFACNEWTRAIKIIIVNVFIKKVENNDLANFRSLTILRGDF
jgi:hypothetical protein